MLDVSSVVPAFQLAAQAGLNVRVHAGEAAGPASVWAALREAIAAATVTEAVPRHAAGQIVRGLTRLQTRPLFAPGAARRVPVANENHFAAGDACHVAGCEGYLTSANCLIPSALATPAP